MAETIREFLVSVGYKVDGNSEARMQRSIAGVTKNIVNLGTIMAATAAAVTAAVSKIAAGFDDIYYASQRTQASVENLKSLSYAVSQLGGSYQGALSSIESFGQRLRSNPGYGSMVRMLGVATEQNGKLRDTVEITKDLAKALSTKPYYIQLQYMEALGLDERTFRALQSGDLTRYVEEYRQKQIALGVDQAKAAQIGKELTGAWRSLSLTAQTLGERMMIDLGPSIEKVVKAFDEFLIKHQGTIVKIFEEIGRAAVIVAKGFEKIFEFLGPLITKFDELAKQFTGEGGLTLAMTAFAAWLTGVWLMKILGAFGLVSSGFGAMLLKLGINPLSLGVAGALALSTSPANGGEDAEIARRRANGTWGSTPNDGTPGAPPKITDKRNWWQRTMPKILGGKDAPETTSLGGSIPGLSEKAADDYSNRLGHRESKNNYAQPGNQFGFRGRWQMGGPALVDAGYVRRGTTNRGLSDPANWLGKDGLNSLDDFLANKNGGQDKAFAAYTAVNYKRLVANGTITPGMSEEEIAGWLAAAHLKGPGGARRLKNGDDNVDANGASASSYYRLMKGLKTGSRAVQAQGGPSLPPLARMSSVATNAATVGGGTGTAGPAPLTPGASSGGGTTVDMTQKTEITILGGDAGATASAVADAQKGVNGTLLRNMQGAVR